MARERLLENKEVKTEIAWELWGSLYSFLRSHIRLGTFSSPARFRDYTQLTIPSSTIVAKDGEAGDKSSDFW